MRIMDERIKSLVKRVKDFLTSKYGKKIRRVILYGSHARGEATEDSDIDLLVLVDSSLDPFEVRSSLSDLLLDIVIEHGELISVIVLHEDFFEKYNYPFMLNVKKESIRV
jgi:predicted nucleotidyltransferase